MASGSGSMCDISSVAKTMSEFGIWRFDIESGSRHSTQKISGYSHEISQGALPKRPDHLYWGTIKSRHGVENSKLKWEGSWLTENVKRIGWYMDNRDGEDKFQNSHDFEN